MPFFPHAYPESSIFPQYLGVSYQGSLGRGIVIGILVAEKCRYEQSKVNRTDESG